MIANNSSINPYSKAEDLDHSYFQKFQEPYLYQWYQYQQVQPDAAASQRKMATRRRLILMEICREYRKIFPKSPLNFDPGRMGVYLTLNELLPSPSRARVHQS